MRIEMRKLNFKHKLTIAITAVITTLVFFCFILYGVIAKKQAEKNENINNEIIAERVLIQIEQLYNQMDTAISYLSYNPALKDILFTINNKSNSISQLDLLHIEKSVERNLGTVLFYPGISNIYLFNKNLNYFYYSGYFLNNKSHIKNSLKNNDYFETIIKLDKERENIMLPPHISPWSDSNNYVISIYKSFSDNDLLKDTIVEVEIPYSVLNDICTQPTFENNKEIIIFDDNYNVIYPINNDFNVIDEITLKKIKHNISENKTEHFSHDYSYLIENSKYTNFNVMLVSNNKYLNRQSTITVILSSSIALLILVVTLGTCFFIFRKLLTPLNELINHINKIDIDNDTKLNIHVEGVDEFTMINDSFNNMVDKLKESMALAYQAEIKEVEASFVALQAQVNPHFLYNTLNAISAASDIYGSEVTQKMCQELSLMLRYTTSNNKETKLIDEINHTKNYLELMKISHIDAFNYDIDIPIELYNVPLPRIIIQPLVENCFKHAFAGCTPPWHINIKCEIDTSQHFYRIIIHDNGIGCNDEALSELNEFINKYKSNNYKDTYKELSIGGLGLKNIYSRLAIFYKSDFNFYVTYENGCKIIIERMINFD
ncbi:histidine kinase [Clostridioides difficile]